MKQPFPALALLFLCGIFVAPPAANSAPAVKTAPKVYRVKFETTKGDFVITVTRAWAPRGADRFYQLVQSRFYDGARFFRVLPGFVAQVGINGNPRITAKWQKLEIHDDPVVESNTPGMVSFATAGPNTRTTQVFISYGNNTRLDKMGFSPFGKVTEGRNLVEQFHSGYGEGPPRGAGPDQKRIEQEGNAYLIRAFPKLDYIKRARVVR